MDLKAIVEANSANIVIVIAALLIFAGAYFYFQQSLPERENIVNDVRVLSRGPVQAGIKDYLSAQAVPLQVALDNASDNLPCKVFMQTEAIFALASSGKNVSLQLYVKGDALCQSKQSNQTTMAPCQKPAIAIETGSCNCVKLDSQTKTILVSGDEQWLCSQAANVRKVLQWGLQ